MSGCVKNKLIECIELIEYICRIVGVFECAKKDA